MKRLSPARENILVACGDPLNLDSKPSWVFSERFPTGVSCSWLIDGGRAWACNRQTDYLEGAGYIILGESSAPKRPWVLTEQGRTYLERFHEEVSVYR